ncbi:MAG: hypothetical protein QM783_19370 [Phycisphaerales bacterium]
MIGGEERERGAEHRETVVGLGGAGRDGAGSSRPAGDGDALILASRAAASASAVLAQRACSGTLIASAERASAPSEISVPVCGSCTLPRMFSYSS